MPSTKNILSPTKLPNSKTILVVKGRSTFNCVKTSESLGKTKVIINTTLASIANKITAGYIIDPFTFCINSWLARSCLER